MKHIFSAALLLSLFIFPLNFAIPDGRVGLKHVDSNGNFSSMELFRRSADRSQRRLQVINARLTNGTANIEGQVYSAFAEYILDLSIGTPPQLISGILDTGSDLIWTQCQPCISCINQNDPFYTPSLSSTYAPIACTDQICSLLNSTCTSNLGCEYYYPYGKGSTYGLLGFETFTFGTNSVSISSVVFGCSQVTAVGLYNSTGIIGFSPRLLSIVSQLSSPRFSYCLDLLTTESSASTLFLGSAATINATSSVQSINFVNVGLDYPPYYYINLTGISLGDTLLTIPTSVFQFVPGDLRTGTIIDSGSSVSFVIQQAYDVVKQEVISLVNLPVSTTTDFGLDLCFDVSATSAPSLPEMTFHFDSADMVVPYMHTFTENNLFCLMMLPNTGPMTIIGNYQQLNMIILYDLAAQTLSFAPAQCKGL